MEFNEYLSYCIVFIHWFSSATLFLMLYYLFPTESYYWDKICDKCNKTTAKYRYVIRFIFGKFKPNFQLSQTTITIEILDSNKMMVELQIPPKLLSAFIPNCPSSAFNSVRFLLYRKEPLLNICNVLVNHNGSGTINVTSVEIQDINSTEANIAFIGVPISCLSKEKANITQIFPSATKEIRLIEADLKPCLTLRATEYVIFFFMGLNLQFLLCLYLIPCSPKIFCNDYSEGIISSVYSGLLTGTINAWIFVSVLIAYRYLIKRSIVNGIAFCSFVRYTVLCLVVILGLIFGGITAVMGAQHRKFKPSTEPNVNIVHEIYWSAACGIGLLIFLGFWVVIFGAIGYLIGFFTEPPPALPHSKEEELAATIRTNVESDDQSTDYYNSILKGNTKVKSISQYTGLSKAQQNSVVPSATPSATAGASKGTQGVQKTPSTESVGSGYYKQLIKTHGKVKSVSQYKGPGK